MYDGALLGGMQYKAENETGIGAAYGTAKSGIGIAGVGTYRPDLIMKVRWQPGPGSKH
jgi:hypothetical protein